MAKWAQRRARAHEERGAKPVTYDEKLAELERGGYMDSPIGIEVLDRLFPGERQRRASVVLNMQREREEFERRLNRGAP